MDRKTFLGMVSTWKGWLDQIPPVTNSDPVLYKGFVLKRPPEWASHLGVAADELWGGPRSEELRLEALRLLAAALKAHYFLFKRDTLASTPVFIPLPDINRPEHVRLVLLYQLFSARKTLMVSQADLSSISNGKVGLLRFPVVIPAEISDGVDLEHWSALEKEGNWLRAIREKDSAPTKNGIAVWTKKETFPFGTLFETLSESGVKALKECGGRWAPGVKSWYLPLGFDVPPVLDYVRLVEKSREKIEEFRADILNTDPNPSVT